MPLQNSDIMLVNRDSASYKYSIENLKQDIGEDVEAQFNGLEWVTAIPSRAKTISGAPNVGSTPRGWNSVESIMLDSTNDVSGVSVGATVTLTNLSQSQSGTYRVIAVDTGAHTMRVDYEISTGGNIVEGNEFEVRVHRDRFVDKDGDTMNGDLTVPSLNGGQLGGFRNEFINGSFEINERGGSSVTNGAVGMYLIDRWELTKNSGTVAASYRTGFYDLPGFTCAIRKDNAETIVQQPVELTQKGTNGQFPVGSEWTISFYATTTTPNRAVGDNAGTFRISSTNPTGDVQVGPITSVVINQVDNSRWHRHSYTFTVTGDVRSSSNPNDIACLNTSLLKETIPSGVLITGAQLEPGPVCTPFERRSAGLERILCERYYEVLRFGHKTNASLPKASSGEWEYMYLIQPRIDKRDLTEATVTVEDGSVYRSKRDDATNTNGITGKSRGLAKELAIKATIVYPSTSTIPEAFGAQGNCIIDNEL